jgi:HYR domain
MRRVLLAAALCALAVPVAALADDNPVITVPANMTVEAQGFSGATVTYTATAVDRRGRPIAVTCTPASGTIFGFGETTVTCTAVDSENKRATKHFKVTVVDTQPPVITVPGTKRVTTTNRTGAVVTYKASAADAVDGAVAVVCAPGSGSRFAVGTTRVTCSAVDARTHASSAAFDVTVVLAKKRTVQVGPMIAPRRGARMTTPPMLRWRAVKKASFYNVQVFRRGQKILSVWPSRPHFHLRARWTFRGHTFRLRPGSYSWFVWPAYGPLTHPRFGKALGVSSFVFVGH